MSPSSSPDPKSSAPAAAAAPYVVEDCRGMMQVLSDGTIVRSVPRTPAADYDSRVEWKDAVYHAGYGLGVRIYRPRREHVEAEAAEGDEEKKKLPVLVYFHGGGFCISSYSWPKNHAVCLRLAGELPAIVVAFDHRLAPEHRVPAQHEDVATALLWLPGQLTTDPWLVTAADSTRVFVTGQSSGGNLVHHLAVRFGTDGLSPAATIAGYILIMPVFFSSQPTQSELETPDTAFLAREMSDRYLRLSMPAGAAHRYRDDPLMNPFSADSPCLAAVGVGRMLVIGAERDLFFRDTIKEYVERLTAMGKDVELVVFAGHEHGFFGQKPSSDASTELLGVIRRFMAGVK